MVGNGREVQGFPPIGAPLNNYMQREEHWSHQGSDSVNAVSFGFVATAILISMFLVMAIFEKFLRPDSSPVLSPSVHGRSSLDLEAQGGFNGKLAYPSPKMTVYASGVSVLMPGDDIPTFIAHKAPIPCAPNTTTWSHSCESSSCQSIISESSARNKPNPFEITMGGARS